MPMADAHSYWREWRLLTFATASRQLRARRAMSLPKQEPGKESAWESQGKG